MMKKMLRLLCAALALCVALPSALADANILSLANKEDSYFYVQSMLAVGGTAYIWGADDGEYTLYSWKEGDSELTLVADKMGTCYEGMTEEDFHNQYPGEGLDFAHSPSFLMTDGQRLLGFNVANMLIFEIVPGEGGVTYNDVVTLQNPEVMMHHELTDDYAYFIQPYEAVVVDGVMYGLLGDFTPEYRELIKLVKIDLSTGVAEIVPVENIASMCRYKDGKLLLALRSKEHAEEVYDEKNRRYYPLELALYDTKTGDVSKVGMFDGNCYRPVWEWSEALQAPVWVENARIKALMDLEEIRQVGFLPNNYANRTCVVEDKLLAVIDTDVYVRDISASFNADVYLNTYSIYGEGGLLFASRYPHVPVYSSNEWYDSMDGLAQAMVTGSDSLDVLSMNVVYSPFEIMLRKGYCADLSGSQVIMDAVDRMYPVYQQALKNKDGKVCAVPLSAYSYGWRVNKQVMEDIGLTMEDMPTNYVELCEFVTRWSEEYADEFDMYTVFSTSGSDYVKNNLFNQVLTDYINYCQAKTGSVRFDTPIFREVVKAIEDMKVDGVMASWEDGAEGIWRESLFDGGYAVVGNFSINDSYSIELPLSITKDTPVVNTVTMDVAFINPKSKQPELAIKYLECLLETMDDNAKHVLFADETEPVENKYYERGIESIQTGVERLEAKLATAGPDMKKELESALASQKEWLEEYKTYYRYEISAEAIEYYRTKLVPTIAVGKRTFLNATDGNANAELNTLIKRYQDKQITIDQFIKEADQKLMMMEMEDQ